MKRKRVFIILSVIVVIFLISLIIRFIMAAAPIGEKVAVLDISGIITQSDSYIKLIHTYRDDPSIKALVVRINTPGGSVAPVQEIYSELKKLKKPIVASMGGSAASGGYYIACAAKTIFANPGTLTGSIGVVMQFTKMKGLYEKIGLEQRVIKSGEFKDSGSAFRDLSDEEKAILQSTVDDVYNQFVDTVYQARQKNLSKEEVLKLADGRIFSGNQAHQNKLIDQLGNLPDAIKYAAKLADIEGKPRVVRKQKKPTFIQQLLGINPNTHIEDVLNLPGVTFRYELSLGN